MKYPTTTINTAFANARFKRLSRKVGNVDLGIIQQSTQPGIVILLNLSGKSFRDLVLHQNFNGFLTVIFDSGGYVYLRFLF